MEIGFASYTGADFLLFYGLLIVAAIVAGVWIPAALRPVGKSSQTADHEELAYLAGGTTRFADSVIAALFARKALRINKKAIIKVEGAQGHTSAEKDLLRQVDDLGLSEARVRLVTHADAIDQNLSRKGQLIPRSSRLVFRLLPALPYAFLLLLGAFRWQAGYADGEPVGYLSMLMILVVVLGAVRLLKFNQRTQAGDAILIAATTDAQRLRRATTSGEAGLAVGLFGTAVLMGTPYAPLHAAKYGKGGCGTGGGSEGAGGCGGGGCGGCGG